MQSKETLYSTLGDQLHLVLEKNGEPVSFGAGAAVLGHPATAIAMLANHLGARGRGIAEAVPVQAGNQVTLRVQGMGSTSLRFI